MRNSLMLGVLLAMAIALTAVPSAIADQTYGNASDNSTSIAITSNVSITGMTFVGCVQTIRNSTDDIAIYIENSTAMIISHVQYNCTYNFTVSGDDANISRIWWPVPDNFTNMSTIQLRNFTASRAVSNIINVVLSGTSGYTAYSPTVNLTPTSNYMLEAGQTAYLSFIFYTNVTTVSGHTIADEADGKKETWLIHHPSSVGGANTTALGITNMNITICPTNADIYNSIGTFRSLTFNGTSQTVTQDGRCINLTRDLNSTYEVIMRYTLQPVTTSDPSGGEAATAVTPVTQAEQQQKWGTFLLIMVAVIALFSVAGGLVWYYR